MDTRELVEACRDKCAPATYTELSKRLGVRPSAVSNWTSGRAHPDAVSCAKMAEITGIPLARVLGIVGETRAVSREEKAVWRRLAGAAATVALAISALPLWAQTPTSGVSEQGPGVYIMRNYVNDQQAPCNRIRRFAGPTLHQPAKA